MALRFGLVAILLLWTGFQTESLIGALVCGMGGGIIGGIAVLSSMRRYL